MWPFSYFFGAKKNISRKYIDLIYNKSTMWATFKPTTTNCVQVGDYGEINPETGEFEYRGNIYESDSMKAYMPELKNEEYKPTTTASYQHYEVSAKTIQEGEISGGPRLNTILANADLNVEYKFGEGKTGAVLIMLRPEFKDLPREVLLNRKLGRAPEFKEKKYRLVTRVVSCPTFVLHISDSRTTSIKVSVNATAPLVPAVSPGGGVGSGWTMGSWGGTTLVGNEKTGCMYHPLFELKKRRENVFRQLARPGENREEWLDVTVPWEPLDENGNEIATKDAQVGGKQSLPDL